MASDATVALLTQMTEEEFQAWVVGLAEGFGWTAAHCRKVLCKNGERTWWETTMPKGWPDLFLVNGPAAAFAELKTESGRQSADQKKWQQALTGAGFAYFLWRPRHAKEIVKFLTFGG